MQSCRISGSDDPAALEPSTAEQGRVGRRATCVVAPWHLLHVLSDFNFMTHSEKPKRRGWKMLSCRYRSFNPHGKIWSMRSCLKQSRCQTCPAAILFFTRSCTVFFSFSYFVPQRRCRIEPRRSCLVISSSLSNIHTRCVSQWRRQLVHIAAFFLVLSRSKLIKSFLAALTRSALE